MTKGKPLSKAQIERIREMRKSGKSMREISRETNIPLSTVNIHWHATSKKIQEQKAGAPQKLSPRNLRILKWQLKKNPFISLRKLKSKIPIKVSHQTIGRVLKRNGFGRRKLKRRPRLSEKHRLARIKIARDLLEKRTDFSKVIFSDEKKFRFDGPDGWRYYWLELGKEEEKEYFSKDYGRYKGVMVWMGISSEGLIHIERMEGKINSETYTDMILNKAIPKIHEHYGVDFLLQQDNGSVHVSTSTLQAFSDAEIEMQPHPALSPDLNPVENLWALLVRRIYAGGKGYESEDALWEAIEGEAKKLTKEEIAPFIDSMTRRYLAVIEKRGSYIQ
jgi:transposase